MNILPILKSHKYPLEDCPSEMAHVYLCTECIITNGQNKLITFEKKGQSIDPQTNVMSSIPFGSFDVGKLAELPCPPFLIKLSSAANVHFHGVAPSWLGSIVPVRERTPGVIRLGDTW